jgi:hypothetical protein
MMKKMKGSSRKGREGGGTVGEVMAGALLEAGGLRSPFEEKCEVRF